jgi:carboxymethylenebutenolidase
MFNENLTFLIVTGPVARFARLIAGQGYIVAAPSSYHEFTGPEPLAYDDAGGDAGNKWKVTKVSKLQQLAKLV